MRIILVLLGFVLTYYTSAWAIQQSSSLAYWLGFASLSTMWLAIALWCRQSKKLGLWGAKEKTQNRSKEI